MNYLKRLGISLSISIITFIFLLLLITLFSYLNVIKGNGIIISNLLITIISIFIGSFTFGKKATKNGWFEGIKFGFIFILILAIINIFIYKEFVIKTLIYYSILLISSIFGSMIGITKKRKS